MRYLAIAAAAAFLAVTSVGTAEAQAVKAGPVALTESQLDSVTAGYGYAAKESYHSPTTKHFYKKKNGEVVKIIKVKIVKKVVVVNGKKITKIFRVVKFKIGNEVIVKRHLVKKIVVNLKKFKRHAGKHPHKKYAYKKAS